MRREIKYIISFLFLTPLVSLILFCLPNSAHAEKLITISANYSTIAKEQIIEIPVRINTDGEKINALGFNIDFSTETLEGLPPNRAGSVFPMWVSETSTRVDCGIYGQEGFSGEGLITTLRFKGRQDGATNISLQNIRILFAGTTLSGYSSNVINLNIFGTAETEEDLNLPEVERITLYPPTLQEIVAPNDTSPVSQSTASLENSSTSFGSKAQVSGKTGSSEEEPLQKTDVGEVVASVKGIFGQNSILWTSILPTMILLAIIVFLGIKLYMNEKKRHFAIERIMDKQLGALAALENKIDIIDQKGPDGKAQYLQELDQVRKDIATESLDKNKANNARAQT